MRLVSALLAVAMMFVMMPVGAFADDKIAVPTDGHCEVTVTKAGENNKSAVQQAIEEKYAVSGKTFDGITELTVTTGEGIVLKKEDFQFLSGVVVTSTTNSTWTGTSNTEDISYLKDLRRLDLTHANCEDNKIPARAFRKNTVIETVLLPDTLVSTERAAFAFMSNLKYVGTKEGEPTKTITFPSNFTTLGESTFYQSADSSSLDCTVELPSTIVNLGTNAFEFAKIKGKVTVHGNATYPAPQSGNYNSTFGSTKIDTLEFENGVTSIPLHFARNCTELTTVIIPTSVSSIAPAAFGNCPKLTTVIYNGSKEQWEALLPNINNIDDGSNRGSENTNSALLNANVKYLCTITFDANGYGMASATQQVYKGDTLKSFANPTDPNHEYTFVGWKDEDGNTFDVNSPITKDMKLTAQWVKGNHITIENGTAWVGDKQLTPEDAVAIGTTVTIKANEKISGDMVFEYWKDHNDNVIFANDHAAETTFVMPEGAVHLEAMPKMDNDDSSWDAGTVVTGVVLGTGAAVLTYHIGTELYAEQVLGKGVAVPKTREEVALKAWELAGKPAVELNGKPLSEAVQAEKWAVESGLMQNVDGSFNGAKKMSKLKALRVLDAAKKLA